MKIIPFLIILSFIPITAFAEDPEIKMIEWIPDIAYKEEIVWFTIQLYDAKYNPNGDPTYRGSYLNDVNIAIIILNENFEFEYIFEGKTKDSGTYEKEIILPWNIKNGKYFVETIAWNNENFAYNYNSIFIDDSPPPTGGGGDRNE